MRKEKKVLERYSLKNEVPLFWNLRQRFEYFTSAAGADHHRTRKRGHCFTPSSENLSEDKLNVFAIVLLMFSILSQLLFANKGVIFSQNKSTVCVLVNSSTENARLQIDFDCRSIPV